MRTIYLDKEFCCHVTNDGTMTAVETDIFDGKCDAYIEGSRFVPEGKTWIREDGIEFTGAMFALWKDPPLLEAAQAQHEITLAEMDAAYREGVNSV